MYLWKFLARSNKKGFVTNLAKDQNPQRALEKQATNLDSKILLVEDNITVLKALKMLLMPFKLPIMEAQNAEAAFELVKKERFDLIITDIALPGMQGEELAVKIRQLEKEQGRIREQIVALTAHNVDGSLIQLCKAAGIDEIFQKPMPPMLLEKLLNPILNKTYEKTKVSTFLSEGDIVIDLENQESLLFQLDNYAILDLKVGEALLGSKDLAKVLLRAFRNDGIESDLRKLKKAYAKQDWENLRTLAHKMKGGSTLGTVRLYYALLHMEKYIMKGNTRRIDDLYAQVLKVIDQTMQHLDKHLV
jgi:CheY-like chemotaxis protein